jgi:formate dehydrogenase accessory protein FdhE
MTQATAQGQLDRRICRANELIRAYPFAAEGLRFYSRVAELQRSLYVEAGKRFANAPTISERPRLRQGLMSWPLLPKFADFVVTIRQFAPEPLANAAAQLASDGMGALQQAIDNFLLSGVISSRIVAEEPEDAPETPNESAQRLLAWLFLQPFAEFLADGREPAKFDATASACPVCGSNPIVGVLRPEGDGGKKSLICMLCAHEWAFRRIYCPACGEGREPQMGFYSAPQIAHVRADVCDTCHTYLKTVDLTKTGLAVPVVDELAAIPLDLWLREHGYTKFQTNLLGI